MEARREYRRAYYREVEASHHEREKRQPHGTRADFSALNEAHDRRESNPNAYITRIVSQEELDRL